jgi:hypothetical protein
VAAASWPNREKNRGVPHAIYPATEPALPEALPERAKRYLDQARGSAGTAPDGAVVLAASAIDAMLKARDLSKGSLYERINVAAKQHIITDDMATWAHDVRLHANDQRHADIDSAHASAEDAARAIDFALALGEYLFVLPDRVRRGHDDVAKAKPKDG